MHRPDTIYPGAKSRRDTRNCCIGLLSRQPPDVTVVRSVPMSQEVLVFEESRVIGFSPSGDARFLQQDDPRSFSCIFFKFLMLMPCFNGAFDVATSRDQVFWNRPGLVVG